MKYLVVADLHGRTVWKDMITKESPDFVLFMGDLVDSFDIPWDKQLANLLDIIQYRKDHRGISALLVGNHDLPYLGGDSNISGYQDKYAHHYESAFKELWDLRLLQGCYAIDNFLFSHAGISKEWCQRYEIGHIIEDINKLLYENKLAFDFQRNQHRMSAYDSTGNDTWQSPTWIRPESLMKAGVDFWDQVVGHTVHKNLTIKQRASGEKYYFCDTQNFTGEYLVLLDGKPEVHSL